MFMSHEPGDQGGPGAGRECRLPPAPATDGIVRGRPGPFASVCPVTTAGVSLPRASGHAERSRPGGGANGRRHVQAAGEHRPGAPRVWSPPWTHPRPHRHTGARGVSRRLPPTWLIARHEASRDRFTSTMRLASKLAHAYEILVPARARSREAHV